MSVGLVILFTVLNLSYQEGTRLCITDPDMAWRVSGRETLYVYDEHADNFLGNWKNATSDFELSLEINRLTAFESTFEVVSGHIVFSRDGKTYIFPNEGDGLVFQGNTISESTLQMSLSTKYDESYDIILNLNQDKMNEIILTVVKKQIQEGIRFRTDNNRRGTVENPARHLPRRIVLLRQ